MSEGKHETTYEAGSEGKTEHDSDHEDEGSSSGDKSPLRWVYLFGIGFNMIALSYALSIGEMLYAVTFVLIMMYLAVRYRMLSNR